MMEQVPAGLYRLDSDNVKSFTSPETHIECLLAMIAACFDVTFYIV